MSDNTVKNTSGRGGRREGAGRPKLDNGSRLFTFRADGEMAEHLSRQEHRTDFIKACVSLGMQEQNALKGLGNVVPANALKGGNVHFFDISIVAGFPVPLDNDERAQDIDILKLLCPYPESSYLIRVQGNSMIDADIHAGDIVIVDKSNRNPSENEVAVCELNGEYTLKHFVKRGEDGWLVPANPEFPEIKVTESDNFSIWGTVTYVIHKPA